MRAPANDPIVAVRRPSTAVASSPFSRGPGARRSQFVARERAEPLQHRMFRTSRKPTDWRGHRAFATPTAACFCLALIGCTKAPRPSVPRSPVATHAQDAGVLNGSGLDDCRRTLHVSSSEQLGAHVSNAKPGDCIVLDDGEYTLPPIRTQGTEAAPIIIKAANTLQAKVRSGDLDLRGAAYTTVQGFAWTGPGVIVLKDCDHCRITRFSIQRDDRGGGEWLTVGGTSTHCRIDHNDFGPQGHVGNMIQLAGAGTQTVQHTRIDHNFFHDVNYTSGNGWECIRAGLSQWSFSSAFSVIEHNLFLRTPNDPEAISLKSSDNILRHNTMRASASQFSLRHGNRTMVYGNYILGDGVARAQGIRVCGGDHKIFNNYIEGVRSAGIVLEGGESTDTTGELRDHKQVYRATVVFNTIVNDRGIAVGGAHPLAPEDCTVAYNVLQGSGPLISEAPGAERMTYFGNLMNGATLGVAAEAIARDPLLAKVGDVFQITPGSPAVDAAVKPFSFVTEDIAGKPRVNPDIGADEISSDAPRFAVLKEEDVGPRAP